MGMSRSSGVCCRPFLSNAEVSVDATPFGSLRMQVPLAKEHRDIEKAAVDGGRVGTFWLLLTAVDSAGEGGDQGSPVCGRLRAQVQPAYRASQ